MYSQNQQYQQQQNQQYYQSGQIDQNGYGQIQQQPQYDQQQQQAQLPMGEPITDMINCYYGNYIQNFNTSPITNFKLRIQMTSYTSIGVYNPLFAKQQDLEQLDPSNTLTIKYGDNQQKLSINKSVYENTFFTKIPMNEIDLTGLSKNITAEDFQSFYNFIICGQLEINILKIPTYLTLFAYFQLHVFLKELTFTFSSYITQNFLAVSQTQNYDDFLLYHFVEEFVVGKPSLEYFLNFIAVQQWCLINAKNCWFYSNSTVSPLISKFTKDQYESFISGNFYLQERIYYFNQYWNYTEVNHILVQIILIMHAIIQESMMAQEIDINTRQKQIQSLIALQFPIEKINESLFQVSAICSIFDQAVVMSKFSQTIEKVKAEKEFLRIENLALKLINKQKVWQVSSYVN